VGSNPPEDPSKAAEKASIPYTKLGPKTILYDVEAVLKAIEKFERKAAE
jgi:hypothetical protein